MSKILKNDSGSNIDISDVGITINNGTQYTIPPNDYLLWAASDNAVTEIGASNLVVNDGSFDLSISDGTDLIKGIFPTNIDVNTSASTPLITQAKNHDVFGRTRVSEINSIFDYNFANVVDLDVYWDVNLASGATASHISNDASYQLNVTTTIGSKAILQSRRHMEYYTGKSHIGYFTGNASNIKQGMRKRLGLFTGNDGYFFELTDTGARVVVRKNGVDDIIPSASWSGDKLDGSGESGVTSFEDKQQLYFIEIGWLGSLGVKFGQIIDGERIIVHFYKVANVLDVPFSQTAVLPFRVELECIATATAADSLKVTCFSYMYEGKQNESFKIRAWDSGVTSLTVNTTEKCIFGIRINSTYGESAIKLKDAILTLVSGNSEIRWRLLHNPTITGSPTWDDEPNSVAQTLATPSTTTYSGGFKAASGYVVVGDTGEVNLKATDIVLGHDSSANFDVFLLVAQTTSSNSKTLTSVNWEEFS